MFSSALWSRRRCTLRECSSGATARPHRRSGVTAASLLDSRRYFFALQSPIDPVAEHLFFVHQIQLLLGRVTPMFIMLSAPQGLLVAGMPTGHAFWLSVRQSHLRLS
jgi:cytochrome c oxidase assembly factor CtaG